MNIGVRTQPRTNERQPQAPEEPWNLEAMESLWARWSDGHLPMVRALFRPRHELVAINVALLSILGHGEHDASRMAGLPLQRILPNCGALASTDLWTSGFLYRTLEWQRSDGTLISIRMLLVQCTNPSTGDVELLGVGVPPSALEASGTSLRLHTSN